jgi:hypothetical protein
VDHGLTRNPSVILSIVVQWTIVESLGNFRLGRHLPKAANLIKTTFDPSTVLLKDLG